MLCPYQSWQFEMPAKDRSYAKNVKVEHGPAENPKSNRKNTHRQVIRRMRAAIHIIYTHHQTRRQSYKKKVIRNDGLFINVFVLFFSYISLWHSIVRRGSRPNELPCRFDVIKSRKIYKKSWQGWDGVSRRRRRRRKLLRKRIKGGTHTKKGNNNI